MHPTIALPTAGGTPVRSFARAREILSDVLLRRGGLYLLLALLPLGFLGFEVATWTRNIPRWDEFDTTLDLLIAMDSGSSLGELLPRLAAVQNEHRIIVSRSLFVASYALFGGINFAAIAVVGNLFLVGALAVLVAAVRTAAARLRLAAILALVVCQLQHHESLFWGGASIDHFFVLFASLAALLALRGPGRKAVAFGCGWAFLATFSLAHGIVVWPVGLLLLAVERRWRAAGAWIGAGLAACALFLLHFHVNPGHKLPRIGDLMTIGEFWLRLLGSSPALDDVNVAPWLGGAFLVAAGWVVRRGWSAQERLAVGAMAWCVGATGMVAWGRGLLSPEWMPVTSRYFILSSVAWAALAGIVIERALARRPGSATWWLPLVLAGLACFNVAADWSHLEEGREAARASETAVRSYHRYGTFAKSMTSLYPDPARADALIAEAQRRGIYRLPPLAQLKLARVQPVQLEDPKEIDDAVYFIEEVKTGGGEICVRGWAFRPDHVTRIGDLAVVFRSAKGLVAFEPTPRLRPDVAQSYERWDAAYAGFELRLPRALLPAGPLAVGMCFGIHGDMEYMMTGNTVAPKS